MAAQHPYREEPGRCFNLTNLDTRPGWSMVDSVQALLQSAAANLLRAKRLAGRAAEIPTLEELTRTWQLWNHRPVTRSMQTHSPVEEVIGGAVTHRGGTQTRPPPTPIPGQVARWAVAATASELIKHEVVQIALNRGVVTLPSRESRVSRIDKRTPYTARPANDAPARLSRVSRIDKRTPHTARPANDVPARLRSPRRASRTLTAEVPVGPEPATPPRESQDNAVLMVPTTTTRNATPRRTRSVQVKAQLKAVAQPPPANPEAEEDDDVLQLSIHDDDLKYIDQLMDEIMSD
ncbi:unnamed protein product [Macrosiphum euphorbiae]|uniref:Uncharacterized protein n=1 Tax=Macrosiphum euphorbiae TaxID=13131 RepID=A0AAV0XAJ6_9HEMI|nr:unnamed protein product [Macrosiphum euphorbiae]